jgi:hypothetical protein
MSDWIILFIATGPMLMMSIGLLVEAIIGDKE